MAPQGMDKCLVQFRPLDIVGNTSKELLTFLRNEHENARKRFQTSAGRDY